MDEIPGSEPVDPLAEMDQWLAGMRTRAQVVSGYFKALVDEGFTRAEALELTLGYQSDTWSS